MKMNQYQWGVARRLLITLGACIAVVIQLLILYLWCLWAGDIYYAGNHRTGNLMLFLAVAWLIILGGVGFRAVVLWDAYKDCRERGFRHYRCEEVD